LYFLHKFTDGGNIKKDVKAVMLMKWRNLELEQELSRSSVI